VNKKVVSRAVLGALCLLSWRNGVNMSEMGGYKTSFIMNRGVYPSICECLNSVSCTQYLQRNTNFGFLQINEMYAYIIYYNVLESTLNANQTRTGSFVGSATLVRCLSTKQHGVIWQHRHLNLKCIFKSKCHEGHNVLCRWDQLLEVAAGTLVQRLVVLRILTLDVRTIWKWGMVGKW
jgi:hypothetical protein